MKKYAILSTELWNGETQYEIHKRVTAQGFLLIFYGTRNEVARYIKDHGIEEECFYGIN